MTFSIDGNQATLQADVRTALQQWRQGNLVASPFVTYALFRQIQQAGGADTRQISNEILLQALQTLENQQPDDADLLRMHFLNDELMQTIAHKRNVGETKVYTDQRRALVALAEIVGAMEHQARDQQQRALEKRLDPPGYTMLVGVDAYWDTLMTALVAPGPPWLIAINGLGGIGKTTLADAVLRRMIRHNQVDALGWVSAKQDVFNLGGAIKPVHKPALTANALIDALWMQLQDDNNSTPPPDALTSLEQRLRQQPHIIVIDNLETVLDVESLLPTLRRLANPSKFLLTSRHSLFAEPDIFHFSVPELNQTDALQLIRYEARLRNLPLLAASNDADLQPIFATVGGNPLALRLVIGQVHAHALDVVLHELVSAQGYQAEQLYTFIYRRAWDYLDEISRRVLLVLPLLPPRGGTLDDLVGVSQLPTPEVRRGLDTLIAQSLVDSRGDLHERRYTIHNLTRTFLQQQVAQWL